MFKNILTISLSVLIAIGSLNVGALAAVDGTVGNPTIPPVASVEKTTVIRPKLKQFSATTGEAAFEKRAMAEYNKAKANGQGFSTGKKIAIGVGIAAAILVIVAVVVSRTEIHPFPR